MWSFLFALKWSGKSYLGFQANGRAECPVPLEYIVSTFTFCCELLPAAGKLIYSAAQERQEEEKASVCEVMAISSF